MSKTSAIEFKDKWGTSALLLIFLYFIYSSTFTLDYLMNDEWSNIGMKGDLSTLITVSRYHLFAYGRVMMGIYLPLVYGFVEYSVSRIQIVRFLNFLSMALLAVMLLRIVEREFKKKYFAFGVVLLFFSLPPVQGLMGYSVQMFASAQPALWFSITAFYVYFYAWPEKRVRAPVRLIIALVLLALAMQSSQTHAFFAMVPLTLLTLIDWPKRKQEIVGFLVLNGAIWLVSALVFKLILDYLHARGGMGYHLGEQAINALFTQPGSVLKVAFNPVAYWSAFRIWTYPFPFHNLAPLEEHGQPQAIWVMIGWALLIIAAIIVEQNTVSKGEWRQSMAKWLSFVLILGFAAIPIIADSPTEIIEHRTHITFIMTGIVIFSGAYSVFVLVQRFSFLQKSLVKATAAFLILMIAFGAQAGVLRAISANNMEQLTFIRTQLMTKDPATYKSIVVVLPNSGWGCITEPCDRWMGRKRHNDWHLQREGVIIYAMTSMGIPAPGKTITFVEQRPDPIPADVVVVDWNIFARTRDRLANSLHP